MAMIVARPHIVQQQTGTAFQAFQYSAPIPPSGLPHALRHVSTRHLIQRRDAMVWRLLNFEHDVAAHNLEQYWDILDAMMEISIHSAIEVLEKAYCTHIRELTGYERRGHYPGMRQEVYRVAYSDRQRPYEDFTRGALIEHALDVLQEQAYALV